jgi:hypothetical protein
VIENACCEGVIIIEGATTTRFVVCADNYIV